ncbi:hypothetical protein TcYC6_0043060 [Trypanosoma cruzi]|nr:hypothetical protein TcYC6_0043060 [Trypanosoma cruzi]
MTAMDTEGDVTQMELSALLVHIERCERLLRHPTLLSRLPDEGETIRSRHALYVAERSRREVGGDASSSRKENDAVEGSVRQVERQISQMTLSTEEKSEKTATMPMECHASLNTDGWTVGAGGKAVESYEDVARAVGEKHRHSRIPVEMIVRQTFGGSLCEAEIQRMLCDVPPNFFLTHDETISMQRKLLSEERLEALTRLRNQRHAEL